MKYRVLQGVMIDATNYNPGAEVDLDENRADVKSLLSNGKLQQVDGQHDNEGLRRTTVAPMTTENSDSLAPGKDYQV